MIIVIFNISDKVKKKVQFVVRNLKKYFKRFDSRVGPLLNLRILL